MRAPILLSIALASGLWAQPHFLAGAVAYDARQGEAGAATDSQPGSGASSAPLGEPGENWRRIRSRNSLGETETAAILRAAEFERSDPRLAGLMLRCAEHGVEAVIVVVEPFPPHARPKITLRAAGRESYFEGELIPTGAGIRLPVDGGNLAADAWFQSRELGIRISDGASPIDGVVDLSGLKPALNSLIADCVRK